MDVMYRAIFGQKHNTAMQSHEEPVVTWKQQHPDEVTREIQNYFERLGNPSFLFLDD